MRITEIRFVPDDEWLKATFRFHPHGALTLRVRRDLGHIWTIRKERGEVALEFKVTPTGSVYYENDLEALLQAISNRELLGIGPKGQMIFDHDVAIQPSAHLVPRDLLGESEDDIRYTSDIPIPNIEMA